MQQLLQADIEIGSSKLTQVLHDQLPHYLETAISKQSCLPKAGVCHMLDSETGEERQIAILVNPAEDVIEYLALRDIRMEKAIVPGSDSVSQVSMQR